MYEWDEAVQKMINWVEENLTQQPALLKMSREVGYSPGYSSSQFHAVTGRTLKNYIAARRLCRAAFDVRDTDKRILDIALEYGFSSQQAFTRAFACAYGCTPAAYRRAPRPIPIAVKKEVLFPEYYEGQGEKAMNQTVLTEPGVSVEYIPPHKYMGIWDDSVQEYCDFWEKHDCDEVCGIIESMSHVMHPACPAHTAGWYQKDGKRGYFYGLGVKDDYDGEVPDGFEIKSFPGSYYLVFSHPPFDFMKDCGEVVNRVDELAWNFDPAQKGFMWNERDCQAYQRMLPETAGYQILRPVKK